jgi:hypothetical protein
MRLHPSTVRALPLRRIRAKQSRKSTVIMEFVPLSDLSVAM